MTSIVTANFDRNNVTPIRRNEPRYRSVLSSLPAAVRIVRIGAAGVRAASRGLSRRRRSQSASSTSPRQAAHCCFSRLS